jgi:hypothetical protein
MPVISASPEVNIKTICFEANGEKKLMRDYVNKQVGCVAYL